jgi:hypothetical protein
MQAAILSRLWMLMPLVMMVAAFTPPVAAQTWGRLANPGFENQRIKATLFFAGQARDGTIRYTNSGTVCYPGNDAYVEVPPDQLDKYRACLVDADHKDLRAVHPLDSAHLRWSEDPAYRDVALNLMLGAGINVINMSSWGEDFLPCAWTTAAAPMQTDAQAHNELFAAAVGKPLLIVPFIESRWGDSNAIPYFPWQLSNEFPQRPDGTISQITNLIHRYLNDPAHPEWAQKWARVFDQDGEERYAVTLIHAGSNLLGSEDHAAFAAGFDPIADEVFRLTQKKVGFFIDALPAGTGAFGIIFKPSPEGTGPYLRNQRSLLGIQCFTPEAHIGSTDTAAVINWKRDFSRRWFETGIPFLLDVSPGYDAHCVFNPAFRYGLTAEWRDQLAQMNQDYGRGGMVFNAWNGYGESLVAVPSHEYGSLYYDWLRSLQYADVYARKPDAPAPRNGTLTSPYTLAEAVLNVPVTGTIGLLPTTSLPFDAPITIQKACTIISIGGSARIGQ